jgi:hypothetical protein
MNEYNKYKDSECFKDKDLNPKTCSFSKKCKPGQVRNSEFKCVKESSKQAFVLRINELIVKINNGTIRKSDATRELNEMRKQNEKDPSINIQHELDSMEEIIKKKFGKNKTQQIINQPVEQTIEMDKETLIRMLTEQIDELYSIIDSNKFNKNDIMIKIKMIEEQALKNNINLIKKIRLLKSYANIYFTDTFNSSNTKGISNSLIKKMNKIKEIEEQINKPDGRRGNITAKINRLKAKLNPENKLNNNVSRLVKLLNERKPLKNPKRKTTIINNNTPTEYEEIQIPNLSKIDNELSPDAFSPKKIRSYKSNYKSKKTILKKNMKYKSNYNKSTKTIPKKIMEYKSKYNKSKKNNTQKTIPKKIMEYKSKYEKYNKSKTQKKVKFANEQEKNLQFKLPIKNIQNSFLFNEE